MAPSLLERTDMTSIIWGAGPLTPSSSIFTIRLPSTMRTGPARWLSPDHTSTWKVVSLKHPYPFIIDSQYSIRRQLHIVNWGYVALHILMCQCQCMCIWTTEYDSVMTLNISRCTCHIWYSMDRHSFTVWEVQSRSQGHFII